jgi:hypothetical protein
MVLMLPHGGIVSLRIVDRHHRKLISLSQFFFFAAINMISFCLALFLPETKGRSLEDMVSRSHQVFKRVSD